MSDLLIRNLDTDVLGRLKVSANANGRSLQAEIHAALRLAAIRHVARTRRISASWLNRLAPTAQPLHTDDEQSPR